MNPKKSLELLDNLVALGFTDSAFARLHHFRLKGRRARISGHRKYCKRIESFHGDGQNERVQRRLKLVLSAYRRGGFHSADQRVFEALADASFYEIPPFS